MPFRFVFLLLHHAIQKYNKRNTGSIGYSWWDMDKYCWKKELFSDSKEIDFEGMKVKIPIGYDTISRQEYGDYMIPVMNAGDHTFYKFDTERPYSEYLPEYLKKGVKKYRYR